MQRKLVVGMSLATLPDAVLELVLEAAPDAVSAVACTASQFDEPCMRADRAAAARRTGCPSLSCASVLSSSV